MGSAASGLQPLPQSAWFSGHGTHVFGLGVVEVVGLHVQPALVPVQSLAVLQLPGAHFEVAVKQILPASQLLFTRHPTHFEPSQYGVAELVHTAWEGPQLLSVDCEVPPLLPPLSPRGAPP